MLDEIIMEFGLNFEFALLKYNLSKPYKSKAFIRASLELFNMEKLMTHELSKVERIWFDNSMLQKLLKPNDMFKLAWRFATLPNLESPEKIFAHLTSINHEQKSLSSLARKLSISFESQNNHTKKQKYALIADQLI